MADLLELYRTMVRIRAFEDAAEIASQGGVQAWGLSESSKPALVRGPLHLSTGQEAVAAGVCAHLGPQDLLTSTHRGHGHTLAKGADSKRMMAELFGRATGYNKGKGGSMHIADFSVGMLGANGVVAAGLPIAVGAAQALKLRGVDAIAVSFFGDGAINRGPFLESLNWAVVYQLPVLFVCEDNRISATTASAPMTGGEGASARANSLGVPALKVDGNDVEAVADAAAGLIADIRAGQGPRLLHALTDRHKGHVSVDPGTYRDPAEVAAALARDPLLRARQRLVQLGLQQEAAQIEAQAQAEIDAALAAAQADPFPEVADAYTDITTTGEGAWR
ncbi:thiamine pyrophosphate-dependent dehydrogenase E1 component subunit alpha [Kerstersia gyiorum]|uniref:thiamine pyrophosphate-dependent dehydrogenase E1 component subunit alpha n=1 Tax=Kerstersia gyiorum TaxID=206506 RepID=UPI001F10044E|nr:thiamine pyrophosphate-dependent dehydrogenase E1 component subunit alpha [Kerstersia gyiorum]MCO7639201.1 thiamine pyrophosphate-dependent dehydrogenase E1 component subunit alpha [Pseudomonas sp. S 311-6]MCP1633745.1 pyruvate dehydrogenase E1 component alpha subunit [Kerstersia gyiorum]MCP1637463.1 pyruvate dehydrogenase E1 component alpha subunit [Kerstersia gyiorum]MCP1671612.1 pyruvate dehydrogenase E1 component alpha subunit [Kerstersia gyiorum]MCP1679494.1 pyruvate dehydrogenase E1 c